VAQQFTRRRGIRALGVLAILTGLLITSQSAVAADSKPFPVFEFGGIVTDPATMKYNPTGEYIFPSIFHAGAYLANPLGEWYLYFAPHENPGGIAFMYADSLEGPWTEYVANPVIKNEWLPYYTAVPHVSSPDAFWNEAEQKLFVYYHGNNGTTRFATSTDGVTFEYGGVAVTNADGGEGTTETAYARVFEHPDPTSSYNYAMFYMDNTSANTRRIRTAESTDGRTWVVRPDPLVVPGAAESGNVSAGNLWEWDGQLYVIYHASSKKILARTVDAALTTVGPAILLHESSGIGVDVGRVAAPDIAVEDGNLYLFYEAGDRLDASIRWAKAPLTNVALGKATLTDSVYAGYVGPKAVDGIISDESRWLSADTAGPHWIEIDFGSLQTICSSKIYMGKIGSDGVGTVPVVNFVLQSWSGAAWVDIPGTAVTGNTSVSVAQTFTSSITTNKVRFYSTDDGYVRVKEINIWDYCASQPAVPAATTNVALGKATLTDSVYAGYVGPKAVDGIISDESRWLSADTAGPHWIEIDFGSLQTICSSKIYMGKIGSDGVGTVPVVNFVLQSWSGAAWVDIPGTAVTGNTSVSVAQTFTSSITTNKVRFYSTDDGYVRVKEINIWDCAS